MLIVHPSSTCDVCLDPFTWATIANTPHAISCGHVFCLQCLQSVHPSLCPLCRKAFAADRIKRLHVDRYNSDDAAESDESIQATGFLQRIALVSGENTPEENVLGVISEVNRWLSARDRTQPLYRPIRYAITALERNIKNREDINLLQDACEKQRAEFEKYAYVKEEDIRRCRAIENNLLQQTQDLQEKLERAERSLQDNESEMDRLRSEHNQFRAELARRHTLSNSIPTAPQLSRNQAITTFSQAPTASSRRSRYSMASQNTARHNSIVHISSEHDIAANEDSVERKPTAKAPSKLFVIVPGAPASRKVVPPSSASPLPDGQRNPFRPSDDSALSDINNLPPQDTTPPAPAPHYGFIPGVGYVHHRPAPAATSHEADAPGQLVLFGHETQSAPHDNRLTPRSVSFVGRFLTGPSGETETPETDWHYIGDPISQNSTSLGTTISTTGRSNNSSPSPSNSPGLGLRGGTSSSGRQPTLSAARPDAPSPEPSLASSWGTVPSHRTSRSASVRDLHLTGLPAAMDDLELSSGLSTGNTSLADLRLTRLPDLSTDNASLHAIVSPLDSVDVAPVTPRALPWHPDVIPQPEDIAHSVLSSGHLHTDHLVRGNAADQDVLTPRIRHSSTELTTLALSLSTSNNSSRLHISGTDDLNLVNRSLLHTVNESRDHYSHRRHSRAVSLSDAENYSASDPSTRADHTGNTDAVQSNTRTSIHRPPVASHRSSLSSGNNIVVPHTDRISGPPVLPRASQHGESHTDDNRRRRRSSVTTSHASSVSSRDVSDVRQPRPEVMGQPSIGYAPSYSHTQNRSRAASVYPLEASSSTHSNSSLGSVGSLGLSLAPTGPGASAATTSSGEPSTIRAPRPVNGSQSGNFFAIWDKRGSR